MLLTLLREVLSLIKRARGQRLVPADIVGDIVRGTVTFVLKTQHFPDLSDAHNVAQTKVRATMEGMAQIVD